MAYGGGNVDVLPVLFGDGSADESPTSYGGGNVDVPPMLYGGGRDVLPVLYGGGSDVLPVLYNDDKLFVVHGNSVEHVVKSVSTCPPDGDCMSRSRNIDIFSNLSDCVKMSSCKQILQWILLFVWSRFYIIENNLQMP